MAWAPSTNFEEDLVDLQPDFNLVYGQLAYEANQKQNQDYTPRPKSTYEYLAKREKRNGELEKANPSKTKEIAASLAMMERIQEISGTKPLGEHATMADWEDESTVEQEAIALMRHFGMMSMADGSLMQPPREEEATLTQQKIQVLRNGKKRFPLILDPSYFEPGGTRRKSNRSVGSDSSSSKHEAAESRSLESNSSTPKSNLDDTFSSRDSYVDIPYELLQTSSEAAESQLPLKCNETTRNCNTRNRRRCHPTQEQKKLEKKLNLNQKTQNYNKCISGNMS